MATDASAEIITRLEVKIAKLRKAAFWPRALSFHRRGICLIPHGIQWPVNCWTAGKSLPLAKLFAAERSAGAPIGKLENEWISAFETIEEDYMFWSWPTDEPGTPNPWLVISLRVFFVTRILFPKRQPNVIDDARTPMSNSHPESRENGKASVPGGQNRNRAEKKAPRQTNHDHKQALLDEGIEESFPASDPPSVSHID